jgi:3-oxoisoapionate decarboxylase
MTSRIPFALTAYSMPHVMGYLPTRAGANHPSPLGPIELMDAAVEMGLSGVELPLPPPTLLPDEEFRDALESRGLRIIPDYMVLLETDSDTFRDFLRRSAELGAGVVRALLSKTLCGDRRSIEEGWEARLTAIGARLREVLPLAEDLGLAVAMENHQDATTEDLIRLGEMVESPAYGVTLDTGNPLSVGQEPVEAARRLAPIIRHVHLKDYTVHFAPEGYRLVRCAAGDGCVDFPAILSIVRGNGHGVLPGIEIAAQATRTIPVLEPGWWACYPSREASDFARALEVVWKHGRPQDEPYSSAWERGEEPAAVAAEEWAVLTKSVEYFRCLSNG